MNFYCTDTLFSDDSRVFLELVKKWVEYHKLLDGSTSVIKWNISKSTSIDVFMSIFLSSTTICTSFPVTIPTVTTALMQLHNIDIVEPDCKDYYYYFICAKITLSTYKFLKQKVLSLALVRYGLVYTNRYLVIFIIQINNIALNNIALNNVLFWITEHQLKKGKV